MGRVREALVAYEEAVEDVLCKGFDVEERDARKILRDDEAQQFIRRAFSLHQLPIDCVLTIMRLKIGARPNVDQR